MADGSHNHVLSMFNILYNQHKTPGIGFDCLGDPAHPDLSFILYWIGVTVALADSSTSSALSIATGPNRGALDGPVTWQKEPAGPLQLPLAR